MMRWVGHVGCMGQKKNAHEGLVGKARERDHFQNLVVNMKMISKYTLKKQDGKT
jgi:hypothetical protein